MEYPKLIPYVDKHDFDSELLNERSKLFYNTIKTRRSIRKFSNKVVPKSVIENCIKSAGTAPSGANLQPWNFIAVSNPKIKEKIRYGAEIEEKEFYNNRAPKEWLTALAPIGTDEKKPFLETAPWLIVIFMKKHGLSKEGKQFKHYFATESVGIATGLLISAIHYSGLVSLTHTPSPMKFLNSILSRPKNEKPYLILVVGYPEKDVKIPDIKRKTLKNISTFL